MENLITILFLLILPLVKPEPSEVLEPPSGIFPYYGFEDDYRGPELTPTIVNLVRSKVYKIEEEDVEWIKNEKIISKSFHDISLSSKGDMIFIYEYNPSRYNKDWDRRDTAIYLINGKQIFSGIPNIITGHRNTTVVDAEGKIIEEDESDSLENVEKIWMKTIYSENHKLNEKIESVYYRIDPPRPTYPETRRGKDPASVAFRDSVKRAYDNACEEWKKMFVMLKAEYKLSSRTVTKLDSVKRTEDILFYDYDRGDTLPWGHEIVFYDPFHRQVKLVGLTPEGEIGLSETTEYQENAKKQLISKTVTRDGKITYKDEWSYDENGKCISHSDLSRHETWRYDAKGNMIEFYQDRHGEPQCRNSFKIYYR